MARFTAMVVAGVVTLGWAAAPGLADDSVRPASTASPALHLRAGRVDTDAAKVTLVEVSKARNTRERFIVQLDRPITPRRRAAMERAGVRLGEYIPTNAYMARFRGIDAPAVRRLDGVRWVGRFRAKWKLAPDVGDRFAEAPAAFPPDWRAAEAYAARRGFARDGKAMVVVSLFADADMGEAVAALRRVGGVRILAVNRAGARGLVDAVVPFDKLEAVAELDAVQFVERAPLGTLRNTVTRWVVQSNVDGYTPLWDQSLHGEGQIAGLIDAEVWKDHCAFWDTEPIGPTHRKLVSYHATYGLHPHGTHTAGTLAGDFGTNGGPDPANGMAYAARISYWSYWDVSANPSLLYPYLEQANAEGARVHSNSWGDDYTTAYTTWCEQADRFSYDYEDSLVVFSASNGPTLKTPENAKNILSVGASGQAPSQDLICYGGAGPTVDDRRKPEAFAPGCGIMSASSYDQCGERSSSGASMAAPAIAGMALLARQYFVEGYYPSGVATPADAFVPSGALLKAAVLNSAVDMTGVAGYPSHAEGWGRVLMDDALYFPGDGRALFVADVRNADGMSTGQLETYHVDVSVGEPLKVTLVFTDAPGTVSAADPVVNDLDLVVTAPPTANSNGTEYLGNHFEGGHSVSGGDADSRNNVEQVHLPAPAAGIYTIEVRSTAINQGTQGHALVVTGAVAGAAPPLGDGDYDFDGDVDLADFASFQGCFTGPGGGPIRATCQPGDTDGDRDVDDADVANFVILFTGP